MDNKINVDLIVPSIGERYNIFIPVNKSIGEVIVILNNTINNMTGYFPIVNNLSITNNDFLKYEDGKYYSDISDSVVYANYTLTTVAMQTTVEDDSVAMVDDKIRLLSNKIDNKLAWFTDTATATLKIKYDGIKSSNTINQVSKIQAGNLDVNMYLDDNEAVKDFVYEGEVDWDKQFEFNLKISNEGNLYLKYKTTLTINNVDVIN